MPDLKLEDDHHCFACGSENKSGLRIHWTVEGKVTTAEFIPGKEYQGWKNVVHGGILATLLDEAMTRLAWIACGGALTAEMTVRFLKPARVGRKIYVRGEIVKENRKLVEMKAFLYVDDPAAAKILIAYSEGKAVKVLAATKQNRIFRF